MKKECKECLEIKLMTDFYAHTGMSDGYINKCKICVNKTSALSARKRLSYLKERGIIRSEKNKSSISWTASDNIGLNWGFRFSMPFTWFFSKNASHMSNRQGGRFMRKESRDIKNSISEIVLYSEARKKIVQNKVWIDILVQKPNNRGDAVNVIDLVCDGIKEGLGVDDKWFCIRRLDWEIVKKNPKIFIGIGQSSSIPVEGCNQCGRLLPFEFFLLKKSLKNGIGKNCSDCRLKEFNPVKI